MSVLPGYRDAETCKENHGRFVQRVVESEIVFGLKGPKGWAVCDSNDVDGRSVLLFWSDAPYATRVRDLAFNGYEVASMTLFDFLFRWLSGMRRDGVSVGTNWTADLVGLEVAPIELTDEITAKMNPEMRSTYQDSLAASVAVKQGEYKLDPLLEDLDVNWPPLPKSGFVSGRAATLSDIEKEDALFVLGGNATPIPIKIPMYAWYTGKPSDPEPVIIIQAEQDGDKKVVGYKPIGTDLFGVATLAEFILLDWADDLSSGVEGQKQVYGIRHCSWRKVKKT